MKLGNLVKLAKVIRDKVRKAVNAPEESRSEGKNVMLRNTYGSQAAIVVKEGRRQLQIQCWNCSRTQWVQRGSVCHINGLCGNCYENIQPETVRGTE